MNLINSRKETALKERFKKSIFGRWCQETLATALMETVVLFPVLISMLMGCFDLGQGIVINQKTIGAAQIMGDLIARNRSVDRNMIQDVVAAGRLALEPSSTVPFGYDIVSVQFNASGAPVVLWRVTENMQPNDEAVDSTQGLGALGEGVVVVTASYNYVPNFSKFIVDDIQMREVSFLRGRRSAVVSCSDC